MNKSTEVEITTDVADSEPSELENGRAVRMAVTCLLFSQVCKGRKFVQIIPLVK